MYSLMLHNLTHYFALDDQQNTGSIVVFDNEVKVSQNYLHTVEKYAQEIASEII